MNFQRAQVKREVKQAMRETRPRPMLVTLAFSLVVGAGSWLLNMLGSLLTRSNEIAQTMLQGIGEGYSPEYMLEYLMWYDSSAFISAIFGSVLVSILISIWTSLMNFGYTGYCLDMARRQNPSFERLFCGFPQALRVIVTAILRAVFIFAWSLLLMVGFVAVIFLAAALAGEGAALFLIFLLAYVALIVGIVWISLRYAMADYVMLDQGLYGLDAIRESKRLMAGNVGRLFVLQMSFIGWYLLEFVLLTAGMIPLVGGAAALMNPYASEANPIAAVSMGIVGVLIAAVIIWVLNLWLLPYISGSTARFYDSLRGNAGGGPYGETPPQNFSGYEWSDGSGSQNSSGTTGGSYSGGSYSGQSSSGGYYSGDTYENPTQPSGPSDKDPWDHDDKQPPAPPSYPNYPQL